MVRQIDADTPPSLLIRLRDPQDRNAWQTFTDVYSPLVYNFCRMRKLQPSDAADVTQEVLLRIAKAIPRFEYDRKQGMFRDWVARIVNNEVHRHFKNNNSLTSLASDWDAPDAQEQWNEHFENHIFHTAIERCRSNFAPETWVLFDQSWLKKRPVKEVAMENEVDVANVYVARSRILKRLRYEVTLLAEDIS